MRFLFFLIVFLQKGFCFFTAQGQEAPMQSFQHQLKEQVIKEIKETSYLTGVSTVSSAVMESFMKVPRQSFVDLSQQDMAYINSPLPIGFGQTISQPFIVVLMTELLNVKRTDRILEIGTGSGYQAAILSRLAAEIYTVEIISPLAQKAKDHFEKLQYKNIYVHVGQGSKGWIDHAPYDGIIVTAAAKDIPQELLDQLKPGGRMVIPLGEEGRAQILTLVEKDAEGSISKRSILPVAFVPFKDA